MAHKLRKIGNSIGIILPKEILHRAGLSPQSEVEIEASEGEIILRPALNRPVLDAETAKWYRGFKARYHQALNNLAK